MTYLFCFKCFKFFNTITKKHLEKTSECDDPEVKP